MKFFLDNLEIVLSLAGLLVIWLVPSFVVRGYDVWKVAAVTAIAVGLLHGMIFWLVRRRQRNVRREAIKELQMMLRDVINNQLTIVMASASRPDPKNVERVRSSVQRVSDLLNTLSEESLSDWKSKYGRTLEQVSTGARRSDLLAKSPRDARSPE